MIDNKKILARRFKRKERERQYNGGVASEESSQEDAEEQEEEKNPSITNSYWENADGEKYMILNGKVFDRNEILMKLAEFLIEHSTVIIPK